MKEKDKEGSWVTHRYQLCHLVTCSEYPKTLFSGLGALSVQGDELQGMNPWWQHTGKSSESLAAFIPRCLSDGTSMMVSPHSVSRLKKEKMLHHGWILTSNFPCLFTFLRAWPYANCSISPKIVVFQLMVSCSLDLCFIHCYGQETLGPTVGRIVIQSPTTYIFVEVFPLGGGKVWEYGDELSLSHD